SCIPVLNQFQSLLVLRDGRVQQLLLGIKDACLKIKQSNLGVHRKVYGGQVGSARLGLLAIRLNGAAYASPDINLVRQFKRNLIIGVGAPIGREARRSIIGYSVARRVRARGDGWEIGRPVVA